MHKTSMSIQQNILYSPESTWYIALVVVYLPVKPEAVGYILMNK